MNVWLDGQVISLLSCAIQWPATNLKEQNIKKNEQEQDDNVPGNQPKTFGVISARNELPL